MTRFQRLFLGVALLFVCLAKSQGQSLVQPMTAAKSIDGMDQVGTITIPAGTTVVMKLKSPLNTVSAQPGSGLYLETIVDVIQQNRIVIPAKTFVQGEVQQRARPGRVKGKGQLQFHFSNMTLPSAYTIPIAASLQSLPGSAAYEARNREGAIQPVDQIDKDASVLTGSVITGAGIGALTHGSFGAGRGALIGAGFGLSKILFKRGDDIHLPAGAIVEMILDHPLVIPVQELARYTQRSEIPEEHAPAPPVQPIQSLRPRFPSFGTCPMAPAGIAQIPFRW